MLFYDPVSVEVWVSNDWRLHTEDSSSGHKAVVIHIWEVLYLLQLETTERIWKERIDGKWGKSSWYSEGSLLWKIFTKVIYSG